MNRGRSSTQIVLCFLAMLLLAVIGCSSDSPPQTYNISGTVSGATQAGVTINLTGAANVSATTDAEGKFSFTGRANGTYTVTPVKAGYTFNPISTVVVVSGANVSNANFVATVAGLTYSLSGMVSGAVQAGVTMTLSGGATGTAITGAGGNYSFPGVANGVYTVTPSLTGYTFTPANLSITVSGAHSPSNNFTAAAVPVPTYSISGAVTVTVTNAALAGVTINLTGAATTSTATDAGGNFNFAGRTDGIYTVTPVKTNYVFTPASMSVTISGANRPNINFVATLNPLPTYTVSGTVSGDVQAGVLITLSSTGSPTTTTNASGDYSFSGILPGSYTVTPSLAGYTFNPTDRPANVIGANVTVPNFIATANATAFTQADLTGTWRMTILEKGKHGDGTPKNKWMRGIFTFDSSGNLTAASSCLQSDGTAGCPALGGASLKFTMNTTTGVITSSGTNAIGDGGHMTMTSNKNFIAGTGTNGNDPNFSYLLATMQKEVTGTVYSNADLQSQSFVIHGLSVGGGYDGWQYAALTTNSAGLVTIISGYESPGGPYTPGVTTLTLSVDGSGVVTGSGMGNSGGFLSADKKTVVLTGTSSGGSVFTLSILQITGQTYTAGFVPPGSSVHHVLGCGATAFWIHYTSTVGNLGVITFSNWVASNPSITAPASRTGFLDASGKVTLAEDSSYHGQVSHDGKFTVSTSTGGTSPNFVYMLGISTK